MIKKNYPVILLYHQISRQVDASVCHYNITIAPKLFEAQVKTIKRYFVPIDVEEFEDARRHGRDIRQRILLTFDDGYREAVRNGAEILRKHVLDSIWFVNSRLWDNRHIFWLSKIMWMNDRGLLKEFIGIANTRFPGLLTKPESDNPIDIDSWAKDNDSRVLEKMADEFFDYYNREEELAKKARLFASPQEIKALAALGTIGNHSASHANVKNISLADFKEDTQECGDGIRKITGERPRYFAFPFGEVNRHWNHAHIHILRAMGYRGIFSVEKPGYTVSSALQEETIPRFEVPATITTATGLRDFIRSCERPKSKGTGRQVRKEQKVCD